MGNAVRVFQEIRALESHPMHSRCENWGEVMRWRQAASVAINGQSRPSRAPTKRYFASAGSMETGYRCPQSPHWHYGEAPTAPPQPDRDDADQIELAACSLDVYHHAILRYFHVNRLDAPVVLRLASKAAGERRGRLGGFVATAHMAYGLLETALRLPAVVRKDRALARIRALMPFYGPTAAAAD